MLHSVPMPIFPLLILAASSAAQPPAHHGGRLFVSPMGEPFRAEGHDQSGLAQWFNQADRNHDGRLTLDEMQADTERFFALLDVNHDGEIDPDEIDRYETVVVPEVSAVNEESEARFGLLGLSEPVASADTNFNRGVSLQEFRHAAEQRFVALDIDHHGYLTLAGLETIRPAVPSRPKASSNDEPPPDPGSVITPDMN